MHPCQYLLRVVLAAGVSLFFVFQGRLSLSADEAAASEDEMANAAEKVFRGLMESAAKKKMLTLRDIDSLAWWSQRIVLSKTALSESWLMAQQIGGLPAAGKIAEPWSQALAKHVQRMKAVGTLVRQRSVAGRADSQATDAASYYIAESHRLVRQIQRLRKQADEREYAIELPEARQAVPLTAPTPFSIDIDAQGMVLISGKKVSQKELHQKLTHYAKVNPKGSVVIQADRRVAIGRVVGLMNFVNKTGLPYTLSTRKRPLAGDRGLRNTIDQEK